MKATTLALALAVTQAAGLAAQTLVGVPHGPNDPGTCSYLSASGCQDKAVFNTSSFDTTYGRWIYYSAQNSRILVNVKYDSNGDGTLDAWRWPTSKVAIEMSGTDPGATVALGTVLSSDTAIYKYPTVAGNPNSGLLFKRVMFFIFQESGSGVPAGRICVSFSNSTNNANDWTAPIAAVASSSSTRGLPCNPTNATMLAEAVAGFHRTGTDIHLFGLHGDIGVLSAAVTSSSTGGLTETYFLRTTTTDPDLILVQAMVTSNGMFTPTISSGDHDYFFRNLDATFDPATGKVYLLRVTPYPFDVSRTDIPCTGTGACPSGLGLLPLRGQLYSMDVGGAVWQTTSSSQSWTLVRDLGRSTGWTVGSTLSCSAFATQSSFQENVGVDLDSLTIHKMPNGQIYKSGGNATLFLGGWKNKNRIQSCVDAKTAGATGAGGTWIDAELYEMATAIP